MAAAEEPRLESPCWRLTAFVLRSPLLAISLVSFGCGSAWAFLDLVRSYPWLAPLGLSFVTAVLHWYLLLRRQGVLALFPAIETALHRPAFELLCGEVTRVKLRGYKWIRLLVLAGVELDEAEHHHILGELSPEFRRRIFQRPAMALASESTRRWLMGQRSQGFDAKELLVSDDELAAHSRQTTSSTRILYRSRSVGEFLEAMRNEETATQEGFSKFQKIINDKFGGRIAVPFVKQNALHEAEGLLTDLRCVLLTRTVGAAGRIPGAQTTSTLISALAPRTWASFTEYITDCCHAEPPSKRD